MSIQDLIKKYWRDSLLRNSLYLMANAGAMAVFGFCFWIICARLFTPEQIGISTSLISAMSLIAAVSILGLDSTLVRLLPGSRARDREFNTAAALSAGMAFALASVVVIIAPSVSNSLDIINKNIIFGAVFIAGTVFTAVNSINNSVFIANRRTQYILIFDGLLNGAAKLILPFAIIGLAGFGPYSAYSASLAFATAAGLVAIKYRFGHKIDFRIDISTLKNIFTTASANYAASIFIAAPAYILPLIVINRLGAAAAGYYYVAFMLANMLYSAVYAIAQSFFAEGSNNIGDTQKLVRRALLMIILIVIPAGIGLTLLGPAILAFFGKNYAAEGWQLVYYFALAGPIVGISYLGIMLLRVQRQMKILVASTFTYALSICGLALLWAEIGLAGIALAWTAGNLISAVISFSGVILRPRVSFPKQT